MLSLLLSAVFLATGLSTSTLEDRVDLIEVNHHCNEFSIPLHSQLIFWDWDSYEKKFVVVAWRSMKDAWDTSDPQHKAEWEKEAQQALQSSVMKISLRKKMLEGYRYRGKFVGGEMYPIRRGDGTYEVTFIQNGQRRKITAKSFRETYSQVDPERANKAVLPENARRGLRNEAWEKYRSEQARERLRRFDATRTQGFPTFEINR